MTRNIPLKIDELVRKEFGVNNVIGSDTTHNGEPAFLLEAEDKNRKLILVMTYEEK